jgi:hypothetical protein
MATESTWERVKPLGETNYGSWVGEMRALLMTKEVWGLVKGEDVKPDVSEVDALKQWRKDRDIAAGQIYLRLESSQKVHVKGLEEDPVAMWTKLESVHLQKRPSTRFNAYDALFSIRKVPEESLQSLTTRVDKAMSQVQDLRPPAFTLADLDGELASMALIRALPADYAAFKSALMLLPQFDYNTVKEAMILEQQNRTPRISDSSVTFTSSQVATTPSLSSATTCAFCKRPGHSIDNCYKYKDAQRKAEEEVKEARKKHQGGQKEKKLTQQAKQAETSETDKEQASNVGDITDNASTLFVDYTSPTSALKVSASSDWTADTGATSHMTPHRHWFSTYQPHRIPVYVANGQVLYSSGIGSVRFQPVVNGLEKRLLEFERVLHVPDLQSNLLSVLYLTKQKSFHVSIIGSKMTFKQFGHLLFTASVNDNNIAYLDGLTQPMTEFAGLISTCPLDITLWHRRFGHLNFSDVHQLISKDLVTGITVKSKASPDPICEPCIAGKQHRQVNKAALFKATEPLELIHSDLHGPLPTSPHGYIYWVTFVDDATRLWAVLLLRKKSETFDAFKKFKAYAENATGKRIKVMRDDKGGEYMSLEFERFLADNGIMRQHTVRNEPHQNGVAERVNRTLAEQATAMLVESSLPTSFWEYAVSTLAHVRNRSPSSAVRDKVPYTGFYGRKPDVSHLRVFGCTAYVHVQKDKRLPLSSHTEKCVFIGYPAEYKGWLFYNPLTRKTIISNTAEFDERVFPGLSRSSANTNSSAPSLLPEEFTDIPSVDAPPPWLDDEPRRSHVDVPKQVGVVPPGGIVPAHPHSPSSSHSPDPESIPSPAVSPPPALPPPRRYPLRNRQPPQPFWHVDHSRIHREYRESTPLVESSSDNNQSNGDSSPEEHSDSGEQSLKAAIDTGHYLALPQAFEYAFKTTIAHSTDPQTFAEAMKRPDAEQWYKAAYDEIQSLLDNGTWKLAKLPPGRKAIGSRWVFLIKRKADGSIERYKGRVVAKGYAQRPGFDYTETFAPTAKWAALRAILALAALEDMELESIDISSAFLNGELEEEVYMEQPEGFHQGAYDEFLQLLKGIYGLKQSPRIWHKKLDQELQSIGFVKVQCDHSIWVFNKNNTKVIIPVFVDDMTIASKSKAAIQHVKDELKKRFKLRDLGPTSFLLGVAIERDRAKRTITLSQRQYTLNLLERYSHSGCSTVSTPMEPGCHLTADQAPSTPEDKEYMSKIPYIHAVGSLLYLSVSTRPDIAFVVGVLARFNSNPGIAHWKAVKHVFRYLKGTLDYKLTYSPVSNHSNELFTTYSDADHGGDKNTGRSTSAYVVKMGTGAISWRSKLQSMVTLSTTEAEYIAAVGAGMEILWLRNLFSELGYELKSSSTLYIDNQSAVAVAKNPEHHGRIKHLDLRYYWLREVVDSGQISVKYCSTVDMPADILTKPLVKVKVSAGREMLGILT